MACNRHLARIFTVPLERSRAKRTGRTPECAVSGTVGHDRSDLNPAIRRLRRFAAPASTASRVIIRAMAERKVGAPDGREWHVRSYRVRFPGYRPVTMHTYIRGGGTGLLILIPIVLLLELVVIPLIVFIVVLPFALLVALVSRTGWVEATSGEAKMKWKTQAGNEQAVMEEVARQLEAGSQRIDLQNAVSAG